MSVVLREYRRGRNRYDTAIVQSDHQVDWATTVMLDVLPPVRRPRNIHVYVILPGIRSSELNLRQFQTFLEEFARWNHLEASYSFHCGGRRLPGWLLRTSLWVHVPVWNEAGGHVASVDATEPAVRVHVEFITLEYLLRRGRKYPTEYDALMKRR